MIALVVAIAGIMFPAISVEKCQDEIIGEGSTNL